MNGLKNGLPVQLKAGLLVVLLAWSCSSLTSLEDEGLILVNKTGEALVYSVAELQNSHHMDLMWKFRITPDQENILQPNESVTVFKEDVTVLNRYKPVEDLVINLWEVVGDSAFHNSSISLTREELERSDFHIEIEKGAKDTFVTSTRNE